MHGQYGTCQLVSTNDHLYKIKEQFERIKQEKMNEKISVQFTLPRLKMYKNWMQANTNWKADTMASLVSTEHPVRPRTSFSIASNTSNADWINEKRQNAWKKRKIYLQIIRKYIKADSYRRFHTSNIYCTVGFYRSNSLENADDSRQPNLEI